MMRPLVVGAIVMATAMASGCRPSAVPASSVASAATNGFPAAALDTLRGTVLITGSDPVTRAVLRSAAGAAVELDDARAGPALRAASGLEVVVRGRAGRAPSPFAVHGFSVRAADGIVAIDGVLVLRGSVVSLARTEGDTVALPALPSSLRGSAGARVWLAGPLDRAPAAYGVLVPAPR